MSTSVSGSVPRHRFNARAAVFFIGGVLLVSFIVAGLRSLVVVPMSYDDQPLPALQEEWAMVFPLGFAEVRTEGSGKSPGTQVWTIPYPDAAGADQLEKLTNGPRWGNAVLGEMAACGELELLLAEIPSLDCQRDLLHHQAWTAAKDGKRLWIVFGDQQVHLIEARS